jgi:hypothetical protein
VDWYVLLTPLVALAVIALLGFTGCDKLFSLVHVEPVTPPTTFTLEVRVPQFLTVTQVRFQWTPPGSGGINQFTTEVTTTPDGTDNLYQYVVPSTVSGMWTVVCRVAAQDTTLSDAKARTGTFTLDVGMDPDGFVRFYTSGRPDSQSFKVNFVGFSAT